MSEVKVVRDLVELFEDLYNRNKSNAYVLGAWSEGRASAFKLAADHCRSVLDDNVSHLEVTTNSEGDV